MMLPAAMMMPPANDDAFGNDVHCVNDLRLLAYWQTSHHFEPCDQHHYA
jgi:hypothetical protein